MSTTCKIPGPDSWQFDLFAEVPTEVPTVQVRKALHSERRFLSGDPSRIFVGVVPLERYLRHAGEKTALTVGRLLDELDWKEFEQRYAATGRAPYAPRGMMGLILYGIMQGIHSLRALERLARLDLGCMWVSGGIMPDHAIIGRFITLHDASLTQTFFESLTRLILKACQVSSTCIAGDGTVIEAACSYYKLLKEEAVAAQAEAATAALTQHPADPQILQATRHALECQRLFNARKANRQAWGRLAGSLRISGREPEAMVQRLKRGRGFAASYKPSILANEDRLITALAVDASSETAVLARMLDQHVRVAGMQPSEVLLDAGYFDDTVINVTTERDIRLLCPPGQQFTPDRAGGLFHKSHFCYDPDSDTYRCPAGKEMIPISSVTASVSNREHKVYAASAYNSDCPLHGRCTRARVRKIKRYKEDAQREALRLTMAHPEAQCLFSRRKVMVEPVFSSLRYQQKLDRFRRNGLAAVRREFALHAMAYNLRRAAGLLRTL